jgi:tetratricopeptide (TPR) repeat protein
MPGPCFHPLRAASVAAALAGILALLPATARGQMIIPDKFENLKVLPKDISKEKLTEVMRGFAGGLGVRCTFCHVEKKDGPGIERIEWAKDDKDEKNDARLMLKMVNSINTDTLQKISDAGERQVTCETCHRGQEKPPDPLADILTEAAHTGGPPAAIAKYKELREQSLEAGLYDFRPGSVVAVGRRLSEEKKAADAIALLRASAGLFPKSADLAAATGQLLLESGDKAGAQAEFERALSIDPNNGMAKMGLQRAKQP